MKSILFLALALLCSTNPVFSQFGNGFSLTSGEKSVLHRDKIKDWKEVESERTINSAVYIRPDGIQVNYVSRETVNYLDKELNKLLPVSTLPEVTETGWNAIHQKNPFLINKSGAVECNGFAFSSLKSFNNSLEEFSYSTTELTSDTLVMRNIIDGVDKFFQFRNNGIKYSYVLNQPLANSSDLIIKEKMILPSSGHIFRLSDDLSEGQGGFLEIFDKNGTRQFSFAPIWCYDASGKNGLGKYVVSKLNELEYEISLVVPESFLNQQGVTYPIVIDPLVIGPTATWTGGIMPSCFTPSFNEDSILITVPAQITVTNLSITSNYYANPFTTAVKADGEMFFSTSCGASTNFTVPLPAGNTAGTAYLEDFNLYSPLMCCHPQNCNSYTFYLKMHLSRTTNGPGCNTTYIYYDPTSLWPFSAYIEGHTVENYGSQAMILSGPLCSNECDFQLRTYTKYGVPPFTITHPWLATPYTSGVAAGCNSSFTIQTIDLTIPNCPVYCDPSTSLAVPAPTVTDACGNVVSGWPALSLTIKPTPNVTATNDTVIACSDADGILNLSACLPGSTIYWEGHNTNGTGTTIIDSLTTNNSSTVDTINYSVYAELNGCIGDTSEFLILTEPLPIADFSILPSLVFILNEVILDDMIQTPGVISSWTWDQNGTIISIDTSAAMIFADPGIYEVCLAVASQNGCLDTVCKSITVLPLDIIRPNVISPNGDQLNDALEFTYLEFFESNHLTIFNRWGKTIFEKDNYQNNWTGSENSDGVYYYILLVEDKEYAGYFHIIR